MTAMPLADIEAPHAREPADVAAGLSVDPALGLTAEAAAERLARHGPNRLREHRSRSPWDILVAQFRSLIVLLLGAAALISMAFGKHEEALAILAVILINGAIGFTTEFRAVRSMAALRRLGTVQTTVRRDGRPQRISAETLVPGDIVLLAGGDVIAADLRLLDGHGLQCDESTLTGESVPVAKAVAALPADTALADRLNMGFKGTAVTRGEAAGVVVATGMDTQLGRISALVAEADDSESGLEKRLDGLGSQLVKITLALVAMIALSGILTGRGVMEMVQTAIALAVAAVPEGLPIVATLALARGMWRMAERNALIENLAAVETLGATTVVFTDKTGTLTENRMTVVRLALAGGDVAVGGAGHAPFVADGTARDVSADPVLRRALEIGVLCNSAELPDPESDSPAIGDPMEVALLVAGAKAGISRDGLDAAYPPVAHYPFDPDRQMMASAHRDGEAMLVAVKGSPPAVLHHARRWQDGATLQPLDEDRRAEWLRRNDALAARGLRVLALAYRDRPVTDDDPYDDLILVGLCCLEDPPRADVPDAIRACRAAGIRVVMVTGDQVETARSIAAAVGIGSGDIPAIETRDLKKPDAMSDAERAAALNARVFARVSPEQKLDLVGLYQDSGEVVAMTGDGVNDAPALKQADIGVAMGKGGTDVAREASDMVLTDDNFASIEAAVEEGRGVFDNLTKFFVWTLPTNGGEAVAIITAVLLGTSLPVAPVQILWINMTTAILLGLMLAFEPKEPGIMDRPPRDPKAPLLSPDIIKRVGLVSLLLAAGAFGIFYWLRLVHDASLEEAQTAATTVFVIGETFYLFNCRSLSRSMFAIGLFTNMAAIWGAAAMLVLQVIFVHTPLMNRLFHSRPLSWQTWAMIVVFGLAVYVIIEIEKRLVGHRLQGAAFRRDAA
jgi:magnesium-transporting ATPase (P-type)